MELYSAVERLGGLLCCRMYPQAQEASLVSSRITMVDYCLDTATWLIDHFSLITSTISLITLAIPSPRSFV